VHLDIGNIQYILGDVSGISMFLILSFKRAHVKGIIDL
jgi:hypothetical protein